MAKEGVTLKSPTSLKGTRFRHTAALAFCIALVSTSLFQFLWVIDAESTELAIDSSGAGLYTVNWTFDNTEDFNLMQTNMTNGNVTLQLHDYEWIQTSKKDFNKGEEDNVTVFQDFELTVVWSDDFESEKGWVHGILDGVKDEWELGNVSDIPVFIGTHDSGFQVWGTNPNGTYNDTSGIASDYFLQSPVIDLSVSENTEMSFWHYYDFENDTDANDGGRVEISIDDGDTWDPISPIPLGYDSLIESEDNPLFGEGCFAGNSSAWVEERFDLALYDGLENFFIRFHFVTNGQVSDYGWYIDDIEITSTTYDVGQVELAEKDIEMGNPQTNFIQRPSNWTIIDIDNPVDSDGLLTEWTVDTPTSGTGKMKIFRTFGDYFEFVGETDLETMDGTVNKFDCSLEVEAGDFIGWYGKTADIWAVGTTEITAYSMQGDTYTDDLIDNWNPESYTFSISAKGESRYYDGTLTSQVFNASSEAIWGNLSWSEEIAGNGDTEISMRTRTGNSENTSHKSWSDWSLPIIDENGSAIMDSNKAYIQFEAHLTTTNWKFTPTLFNVRITYSKYSSYGEITTNDLIPDDVVQWRQFSTDTSLNGQHINFDYSLDSGDTWHSVPPDGRLFSVSVLTGKIRFRMSLSTDDTTITPGLRKMTLDYSSAKPKMELLLEVNKKTAKPGDIITYNIFYRDFGIGDAMDVSITLFLDENLSFTEQNSEGALFTIEGNILRWKFEKVEPDTGKSIFSVDSEVLNVEEGATISSYAVLNYTDIGENKYPGVTSDTITTRVTQEQDLETFYLILALIIAVISISVAFLIARRLKAGDGSEERIDYNDAKKGRGYLIMEENPKRSYGLFSDLIDQGHEGLCVTREFPGRVRTRYTFDDVSLLWLSRAGDSDSILPTNLGGVLLAAKDFTEENEDSVILFDGLEYLIVHNDFPKVLKLVHGLNELTAINEAILIIPLNPQTLDKDKIALLKRELKILG